MIREALNYPPSGKHGSNAVIVGGLFFIALAVVSVVSQYFLDRGTATAFTAIDVMKRSAITEDSSIILVAVAVAGFYLCVHLVFRGYYVAVLRTVAGVSEPVAPPFRGTRLLTDGIKSGVILLGYLAPTLVLGGFGLFVRRSSTPDAQSVILNTVGAFAFLLGLFALIIAAYLVPAATTLFAQQNSLRAAFELSTVRTCVFTEDYAVGWIVAGVVRIVFVPIAILLELVLVGFFVRFYVLVSIQHLYAMAVTNALGLTDDSNELHAGGTTEEHPSPSPG